MYSPKFLYVPPGPIYPGINKFSFIILSYFNFILSNSCKIFFIFISCVTSVCSVLFLKFSCSDIFSIVTFCFVINSSKDLLFWEIAFIFVSIFSKFKLVKVIFEVKSEFNLFSNKRILFIISSLNII